MGSEPDRRIDRGVVPLRRSPVVPDESIEDEDGSPAGDDRITVVELGGEDAGDEGTDAESLLDRGLRLLTDMVVDPAIRVADALIPQVVRAVLDRVDLTAVVVERIDLDSVLRTIDVGALLERIDPDELLDRVDVNGLIDRVDLNALIERLDLAAITLEVIEEIDLSGIIRESAGDVAGESVEEIGVGTAAADHAVTRAIDRVLRRRRSAEGDGEHDASEADETP
jgi:hypothetical protein